MGKIRAFAIGILFASSTFATTMVVPGQTVAPVPAAASFPTGATQVFDTGSTTLTPGVGSLVNGVQGEAMVYRTTSGTLDFFYQITNNNTGNSTTDNLRLVTAVNFTGFTTAVGYVTSSGSVAPSDSNRTLSGAAINFDFLNASGQNTLGTKPPSGLGSTSYWLEVDTNATTFCNTCGSLSVQDGGNAAMLAPAPTAVPEPATLGFLGGGLALLGIARLRKRKTA